MNTKYKYFNMNTCTSIANTVNLAAYYKLGETDNNVNEMGGSRVAINVRHDMTMIFLIINMIT